jgi:mono/diheme cytochrome c family protein
MNGLRRMMIPAAMVAVVASRMPSLAQDLGDPVQGGHLAESLCGSCHLVAPTSRDTVAGVPTFAAMARSPSTTPLAIRTFLRTSHRQMPNLRLNDDEADQIIAYILSLRRR